MIHWWANRGKSLKLPRLVWGGARILNAKSPVCSPSGEFAGERPPVWMKLPLWKWRLEADIYGKFSDLEEVFLPTRIQSSNSSRHGRHCRMLHVTSAQKYLTDSINGTDLDQDDLNGWRTKKWYQWNPTHNMFENCKIFLIQANPHLEKQALGLLISSEIPTLVIRDFIICCYQS